MAGSARHGRNGRHPGRVLGSGTPDHKPRLPVVVARVLGPRRPDVAVGPHYEQIVVDRRPRDRGDTGPVRRGAKTDRADRPESVPLTAVHASLPPVLADGPVTV